MPPSNFGPWTTSLTAESRLELNAFWRSRLIRLGVVSRAGERFGVRASAILGCVALLMAAVPLLRGDPQTANVLPAADDASSAGSRPLPPQLTSARERQVDQALGKPIDIDFPETPLTDAIATVAGLSGVRIRVDVDVIEKAGIDIKSLVTLTIRRVSPRAILKLLLEPLTLDWSIEEDELLVSTHDEIDQRLQDWTYDVSDFDRHGLTTENLSSAITSVIDPKSWESAGGKNSLRFENGRMRARLTPPAQAELEILLRQIRRGLRGPRKATDAVDRTLVTRVHHIADLRDDPPLEEDEPVKKMTDEEVAGVFRRNVLPAIWREQGGESLVNVAGDRLLVKTTVGSHAALEDFLATFRLWRSFDDRARFYKDLRRSIMWSYRSWPTSGAEADEHHRRAIRDILELPRTVSVSGVPLDDLIGDLQRTTRIRIWFNNAAFAEDGPIDPNTPVTIDRSGVPLSSILDEVLLPHALDWTIFEQGILMITSRRDAASRLETRVHRTKEALATGLTDMNLLDRIKSEIEPASWTESGRTLVHPMPGLLVVTHNRRVQEDVDRLLKTIEERGGK